MLNKVVLEGQQRISCFLLFGTLLFPIVTFAQSSNLRVFSGEYILEPRPTGLISQSSSTEISALGDSSVSSLGSFVLVKKNKDGISEFRSEKPSSSPYDPNDDFCVKIMKSGLYKSCSPNFELKALGQPNDPQFASTWGLSTDRGIDAPGAWDIQTSSSDEVIAVIDTGMDYTHPDLAANAWVNPFEIAGNGVDDDGNGYVDDVHGMNAVTGSGDPMDDNGHGTHVSGTIGAVGNNGVGVAGINWDAKIMALKFLAADGGGSLAGAIQAINYMVAMKNKGINIRVSNNSWGGAGASQPLRNAIASARDAGIVFVAAAGNEANDNDEAPAYPASYDLPNVVSVAAIDQHGNLASFSNYGASTVHIAAPGVGILSTVPGNHYASYSGTSMATPHVTGSLALLSAADPSLNYEQLIQRLKESGVTSPAMQGLLTTSRVLNVSRMVRGITVPLPEKGDADPCSYSIGQEPYSPDRAADRGQLVLNADELDFQTVYLPFEFPFYGRAVNKVTVSPNGVLYMGQVDSVLDFQSSGKAPLNSIAALHSDLASDPKPLGVYMSATRDKATFLWSARPYGLARGSVKVYLTLYADGSVTDSVEFSDASALASVQSKGTIGIRGASSLSATTFLANGSAIGDKLQIRYSAQCSNSSARATALSVIGRDRRNTRTERKVTPAKSVEVTAQLEGTGTMNLWVGFDKLTCSEPIEVPVTSANISLVGRVPRLTESVKTLSFRATNKLQKLSVSTTTLRGVRRRSIRQSDFNRMCNSLTKSFRITSQ